MIFLIMGTAIPLAFVYAEGNQLITCEGNGCRLCDLVFLGQMLINFMVMIGSIVATIGFIWAGFLLVTSGGNQESRSKAKGIFTDVVVGLVIMLTGFIVVNTIMLMLVDQSFLNPRNWWNVPCVSNPVPEAAKNTGTTGVTTGPTPTTAGIINGDPVTAEKLAEVKQQLAASGISVQGGVQLVGVSGEKLDQLVAMAQSCAQAMGKSCGISISSGLRTAGSSVGVGEHGTGLALDLSGRSETFNTWMRSQSGYTQVVSFKNYDGFVNPNTGTKCTWEPPDGHSTANHWHCR